MSRLGQEISRAFKRIAWAHGGPIFTWNGNDYPCVPSSIVETKIFGEGGFAPETDLTLFVQIEDLPDPGPTVKQTLTYRSRVYDIDTITEVPGSEQIKIGCKDPNRAA